MLNQGNEEGAWCDPTAVLAGKRHVAKRILLGGDFTEWNDFTGRMEYRYIKKHEKEEFQKRWAMYSIPHCS